jgi:uncharacterized protein (TIGR03437 family)
LTRTLALLAAASATASAQFNSLATTYDGASVYFTTTQRLKNKIEQPWGKVFAADERGVREVVSRELRKPPLPFPTACVVGRLYTFGSVELSADGATLAATGWRYASLICRGFQWATLLRSAGGSRDIAGRARLSANGRWALIDTTSSVFSQTTFSILDLTTGARSDFQTSGQGGLASPPGRAIADDGTAVASDYVRTSLARPGGVMQSISYGYVLAISADGTRLLYQTDAVHLVDLASGRDESWDGTAAAMDDAGGRVAMVRDGQLFVADFGGGGARPVGSVAEGLASAILSGSGKIAYAVTKTGRLVKIAVDSGDTTEIVARTPSVTINGAGVDAGQFLTIPGQGLADQSYSASAPLPFSLGGVSVTVDGRPVPLSRVTPTAVDALIPWDTPAGARTVVVNTPPSNTPFTPPSDTVTVESAPRAGALYRENWSALSDLTVHTGEVIHVYAVGLGAVTPEVPAGRQAPDLAPLASPMTCSNATVLYAGLQPGTVARIYQVDLKIGTTTGYQQFTCATGGLTFAFLTLNVI